jgi:hypothetical protein
MDAPFTRITIQAPEKRAALLTARKIRRALERAGTQILRGEYVRNDGDLYIDVPASPCFLDEKKLVEVAGDATTVSLEEVTAHSVVDECLNCGNVPEAPFAVCMNCGFREISACPNCGTDVPRSQYVAMGGNLFQCPIPTCQARVRLAFNEPLWRDDGHYNEPTIIVTIAVRRTARRTV